MDTKTLFQTLAKVGLCLSSLLVTNCSKTVSHADALLKEEEQVLVQSSFYPGEMNPQAVQRYGNSLAVSTSTAAGTDGGVITNPNGGVGGSDTGSIPAPGGSTGGSTTNPSNPSTGGSTGGTAGTTPTTPSNPSTPPASGGTVDSGTPSTPTNPSTPTTPSNPSTPAPGGSDGGTIIGGNPSGGSDTGSVPPSNGGGNDGGSAPSNPTTPANPSTPGDTAGNNPPSTPSNPTNPTTPSNPSNPSVPSNPGDVAGGPSTPVPGGNDGGTVPGGSNPPGGGNDGGTVGQNPTTPSNPGAPSNPTTPTNPSTPTTPVNPGDTAGNNPPSTPSNPSNPGGGVTPPGTTPGGPIASNPPTTPPTPGGNDGGTVPGTNPPGGGSDGGTTPPVVPPVIPGSGMDVQINRVCSVMRSKIPFPGFVFFEDAARPIVAFESMVDLKKKACVSISYYQKSNKKTQIAAVGLMGMLDKMERTESNLMRLVFEKIDLKGVNLVSAKFKTAVQFKLAQVKTLFPTAWQKIYLNATVCDDTTKDGSCIDEPSNRILSVSATGVELGKLPKLLNLYVWSGRHLTLKGDPKSCEQQYSPLVLDLDGNGFALTGPEHGLAFDLNDTGVPVLTGWAAGKDDAFLVRDLNGNGDIDSGAELFGSATRLQSGARAANGFAALAELDSNGDGVVSSADDEWDSLRLWIDANYDGHAQPKEMYKLSEKQIESIRVDYMDLMEVDRYGNQTRQRSTFRRTVQGVSTARMVIDVWFNTLAIQH